MVRPNRLKQTVKEGKVAKGLIVLLPHPNVIEILGSVGWDYFMLEMEHGSFGIETAKICFLAADAAGITPMAKVPAGDPFAIMEVLDAGCQGIVAPHIATVEDARGVVRACRHQPEGDRSVCTGARSAGHAFFNNPPDYPQQADREVMIVLLVEEEEGGTVEEEQREGHTDASDGTIHRGRRASEKDEGGGQRERGGGNIY